MTTEPRDPALDDAIRDALRARESRRDVPAFDELWAAAEAAQRRELELGAAPRIAARTWSRPALAAAAAVILVVGLGLLRSVEPPQRAVEDARTPAAVAVDYEAFPRSEPVIWYGPTDALLQIPALRYGAQPASLTYYDPIHLEVRE